MAWNIKYFGGWVDFNGNSNRLEILTENVVSPAVEININSFELDYSTIDLFGKNAIYGCGAKLGIMSNTKLFFLDELYTINPQGVQVRHFVNSSLNYIGYLDTEQYTDDFSQRINYNIELTANNGLAVLDRIRISDNDGNVLSSIHNAFDVVKMAMQKLDISFDFIYVGMSTSLEQGLLVNETILHKLFIKGDNYIDEKGYLMSCREAINSILLPLSARLFIHQNSIYILDINSIAKGSLSLKSYLFSTLEHQGDNAVNNSFNIDEFIDDYSLSMKPGVSKVNVKFNKYIYDTPTQISNDDLFGFLSEEIKTKSGDTGEVSEEYIEKYYSGGWGEILDNTKAKFVYRRKTNEADEGETFIRLEGVSTPSTFSPAPQVKINTNQNFASSKQYLRINGQVMVENLNNFLVEEEVAPQSALDEVRYVFKVQFRIVGDGYTDYWQNSTKSWREYDGQTVKEYTSFAIYAGAANNNRETFPVNRWIDLSNVLGEDSDIYSFIIPLNSDLDTNGTYEFRSLKGGRLEFRIACMDDGFLGGESSFIPTLAIKNLSYTLVTKDEYGNYVPVENNDEEYQGSIDENFVNDLEVETKHGTDLEGNSRGMFLLNISGNYSDSDYATNERVVNANNFVRVGFTGTTEELLLRTYLSNLQQSRYLLNCKIPGYYSLFNTFIFDILQRNEVAVRLAPVSMTVDYMAGTTSIELNEIVKDQ